MGIVSTAIGILITLFGGLLLFGSFAGLRQYIMFKKLDMKDGREISDGDLVGVKGKVDDNERLESTVTDSDCVAYKWELESYTSGDTHRWNKRKVKGESQNFSIETRDGLRASVEVPDDFSPRAHLEMDTEIIHSVEPSEDPPDNVKRLIEDGVIEENTESSGQKMDKELNEAFDHNRPTVGSRRFREARVEDGDEIILYGTAEKAGTGIKIKRDKGGLFTISDSSVEDLTKKNLGHSILLFLAGIFVLLFGFGLVLA